MYKGIFTLILTDESEIRFLHRIGYAHARKECEFDNRWDGISIFEYKKVFYNGAIYYRDLEDYLDIAHFPEVRKVFKDILNRKYK